MSEVIMRVEGLAKRYGSLTAVKSLDLDIYAGEILGFLGPNGAGKTTSINMMTGLLRPDAGRVMLRSWARCTGCQSPPRARQASDC